MTAERTNPYQKVTDAILAKLEDGVIPWHRNWKDPALTAVSHATGKPYSGIINQMLLEPGEHITFNAAKAEGGHIRKGARSKPVLFFKMVRKTEKDENGEETVKVYPFPKIDYVFNVRDTEGVNAKFADVSSEETRDLDAEAVIDDYLTRESRIRIMEAVGGDEEYDPASDEIRIPSIRQFDTPEKYYNDMFHMLVRSTADKDRCDRPLENVPGCATKEQLVAEIGAAMLCSMSGLDLGKTIDNSAAYIEKWKKALKADISIVSWASKRAEKAVDYILCRQDNTDNVCL